MAQNHADRNLLYGLLALQNNFIDHPALIAAIHAWVADKQRPMGQILLDQKAIDADTQALLQAIVGKHLDLHGGDPERSLADLSSIGDVRPKLADIRDPDVQASLGHVSAARSTEPDPHATRPGSLGDPSSGGLRFRVLRPHARGNLGEVFIAHDTELNRDVALKQIQERRADDPQSRARFLLEAEVTGGLEHPGIVPVYGLGHYDQGRPFYAMRFVRGDSLKDAISRFHSEEAKALRPGERRLALQRLLGRFVDVCDAVSYAHSRGVLHRDLKPGNILLGKYGETLVVDWGLAKPLGRPEPEATDGEPSLQPSSGSAVEGTLPGSAVGTPAYMSPEQAAGQLDRLGFASDVYGLGATLYHLLTGHAAFEDAEVGVVLQKAQRGDFPRPRTLDPSLDPALEAVCLRAMALNPQDRYPSPRALADEIERWMADEPVSVYRDSLAVRLTRWGRKHRTLVATAAAVLIVAATAGLVVASQQAAYARAIGRKNTDLSQANAALELQRRKAEQREQLAIDAVKRFGDAVSKNTALKNNPALEALRKELLKEPLSFFKTLRDQLQADQDTRPESLNRLASAAFGLASLTAEIGNRQDAMRAFEETLAIFERLVQGNPTVTKFQQDLASSYNNIANLQSDTGHAEEALKSYGKALVIQDRLVQENPTVTEFQQDLAASHHNLGLLQSDTGHAEEALKSYGKALAIRERLVQENPTVTEFQQDLARSHNNIGALQSATGHADEALKEYGKALVMQERLAQENPTVTAFQTDLARSYNNIGLLQMRTGHAEEALKSHGRALVIQDRLVQENPTVTKLQNELALSHNNIGILQSDTGHAEEALKSYGRALVICERLAQENPMVTEFQNDLARSHNNIGNLRMRTGHAEEALKSYGRALVIQERLQREHPESPDLAGDLGGILNNMAAIDLEQNRYGEARAKLREAIAWQEKALAANPNHPDYRQFLMNHQTLLVRAAQGLNEPDAAAEAERALYELRASDPRFAALDARLNAVVRDEPPKDNAERLALAQRAYDTGRHAAAARLWGEALQNDPKMGDDRQAPHRYNAACAAALAGCGSSRDDPAPDEAARGKLRNEARAWLEAELAAWTRFLDSAGPAQRGAVVQTLRHWQADTDLAGVRDEAELAKLPDAEQTAWRKLWADVGSLLKKVEENSTYSAQ